MSVWPLLGRAAGRCRPPGGHKVYGQYAYFPKDPFHVAAHEIDVWTYHKGSPTGDDVADVDAYTPVHTHINICTHMCMYPSRPYVIIQLNGQRYIAHTVRDRRTVFAGGTQARPTSLSLSLLHDTHTRAGSGKIRSNSSNSPSCRLRVAPT